MRKYLSTIIFYSVYLVLVIAAVIAIKYVCSNLTESLKDFENTQPKYTAEKMFNDNFAAPDFSKIFDENDSIKNSISVSKGFETKETFVEYMNKAVNGAEITYKEVPSNDSNFKNYEVYAKDTKIFEYSIKKSGQKSEHNNELWVYDKWNVYCSADNSITVKALKNSTVYINNVLLDEAYIKSTHEEKLNEDKLSMLPEGTQLETLDYNIYTVDNLLITPIVSIKKADGSDSTFYFSEEEKMYIENKSSKVNDDFINEYSEYAIKAAQTYSKYMTNDATISDVAYYFEKDTAIYDFIRKTETIWYAEHERYVYEDESIREFIVYNDNLFSCRYHATQRIYRHSREYIFKIDLTLYFNNKSGKYLVYNMTVNSNTEEYSDYIEKCITVLEADWDKKCVELKENGVNTTGEMQILNTTVYTFANSQELSATDVEKNVWKNYENIECIVEFTVVCDLNGGYNSDWNGCYAVMKNGEIHKFDFNKIINETGSTPVVNGVTKSVIGDAYNVQYISTK